MFSEVSRQFQEGADVADFQILLADAQENLLLDAVWPQTHCMHGVFSRKLLNQPARQSGHTTAASDHQQQHIRCLDHFLLSGSHSRWGEKASVDIKAILWNGVGKKRFISKLPGDDILFLPKRMIGD